MSSNDSVNTVAFKVIGTEPLLLNNPRTVDAFDEYAKAKKVLTSKRSKTDEDLMELRRLEVESKLYFDDMLKIYIPGTWVSAALAGNSWAQVKIKKAEIRAAVLVEDSKIKLHYHEAASVDEICDISGNNLFIKTMLLKQGQVKLAKCFPVFHHWWFQSSVEFDKNIIDRSDVETLLRYAAKFGGFGDFRPTYGRAEVEFLN